LYSCKKFDTDKVIRLLDETFGLEEWHGILYNRANHNAPQVKMIGTAAKQIMVAKVRN
jgi:hypothetical protein